MGPQYGPKRIFNDFYCPASRLWLSQECLHKLGAQLVSPGCRPVMALGAKFGPPARWPMDLFHGTYPAWPMIG